jgi:hypothetical protein
MQTTSRSFEELPGHVDRGDEHQSHRDLQPGQPRLASVPNPSAAKRAVLGAFQALREDPRVRSPVSTRFLAQLGENANLYGGTIAVMLLRNAFDPEERPVVEEYLSGVSGRVQERVPPSLPHVPSGRTRNLGFSPSSRVTGRLWTPVTPVDRSVDSGRPVGGRFGPFPSVSGMGQPSPVGVAEWIARVYQNGPRYRVVVEGLLSFDVDGLAGVEERTAAEIVGHLHSFFPRRAAPREDPTAQMVLEFEVAVRPTR